MNKLEKQINTLLDSMTLEEKILQLSMKKLEFLEIGKNGKVTNESLEKLFEGKSCGLLQMPIVNVSPKDIAVRIAATQNYLKKKTKHGIPGLPLTEGLHGMLAKGCTVFPQSIALGSSWNLELIQKMGTAIAREASACGIKQLLSPVFDVIRDHRWGRVEECYSEDPYLTSELGAAFVIGAQGPAEQTHDKIDEKHVACTAKHFIGYSMPLRGINLGPTLFGERELRSTFLEPFEKAVKKANIYSVMPSYSEIDGIPVHSSEFMLRDVLREELGFDGYTISDYLGIKMLIGFQQVAADKKEAALQALRAGVDVEAPVFDSYKYIPQLVEEGRLPIEMVNQAVANILRVKMRCKLFDNDFKGLKKNIIHNKKHITLSRKLAEESIILLENKKTILPLDKTNLKKLAVIGPNVDRVQFGDYSWTNNKDFGVTVFEALKNNYSENLELITTSGCDIWHMDKENITEAVNIASNTDAIILVLGGTSMPLGGVGWEVNDSENTPTCGEGFDRDNLAPPGRQMELFNAMHTIDKPLIVVLLHGRPWTIPEIAKKADALIEAWYSGEQGGNAIADIIFGKVNPSGRLPVSIPRSVGQMPLFYNRKPSGSGYYKQPGTKSDPGRDYVFETSEPLYPFGYGLSYTNFKYGELKLSSDSIPVNGTVEVLISVRNIGHIKGKETVQLYINDIVSSVTTPVKVLRGFEKVELAPGENIKLMFKLKFDDFALWNRQKKKVVEPGEFELMIGRSAKNIIRKCILKIR